MDATLVETGKEDAFLVVKGISRINHRAFCGLSRAWRCTRSSEMAIYLRFEQLRVLKEPLGCLPEGVQGGMMC
jgi:hypothetical protein